MLLYGPPADTSLNPSKKRMGGEGEEAHKTNLALFAPPFSFFLSFPLNPRTQPWEREALNCVAHTVLTAEEEEEEEGFSEQNP